MNFNNYKGKLHVLLVEDNPGDIRLIREAMKENNILYKLNVVQNGTKALQYLKKIFPFEKEVRPDLILLDLNLPKKNGFEVLGELKQDMDLKSIPVVILSTSRSHKEILKTYSLHANCYISKPGDLEGCIKVIKSIEDFWFSTVELPTTR